MKREHVDFQGRLDHKVQLVAREFPERLEIQDQWESQAIGDQRDHQEKLDLMENLDLQVQQENQDFQDLQEQEDSLDFQVIQD